MEQRKLNGAISCWLFAGLAGLLLGAGCATDRPSDALSKNRVAVPESSSDAAKFGPMTWLHARKPFWPEWEELDTDDLGERQMILEYGYSGDNGGSRTTIILDRDRLHCRVMKEARSQLGLVAEFFFEPGTDKPVAYSGAGHCATEPPHADGTKAKDIRWRFACAYDQEASLELHGYAWPFERSDDESAKELSQARIAAIKRRLGSTALPHKVSKTVAHGMQSTRAPVATAKPVFGVYVAIDDPKIGEARRRPQFLESTGPPMTKAQFDDFRAFVDENAVTRTPQKFTTAHTWFSLEYWTSKGRQEQYSASLLESGRPVMDALEAWSIALAKSDCQVSDVGSPRAFLK